MARIMLLDDEDDLRDEVSSFLKTMGGFDVTQVCSIRQFHQFFEPKNFDIVILDAMLPDGDGFTIAEEVSRAHPHCGVVMFSARDSTRDRLHGYGMGVDHYVTKPVRMEELLAILKSLERRVCLPKVWKLSQSEWHLLSPSAVHIPLSSMEFKFLSILNAKVGLPVSRRHIVEQLGKDRISYDDRNLDALVLRLRRKVRLLTAEDFPLKTIHGSGYTLSKALSTA